MQSNKSSFSKIIKPVAALFVCLALVFLLPARVSAPVRGFFSTLAAPFEKIFYLSGQKTGGFFSLLGSISKLQSENTNLTEENLKLLSQVVGLQDQAKENELLREQLKLAPRDKYSLEAAFIIGRSSQNSNAWLLIDKGSSSGVAAGMPVIVSDGILVGKVTESYPNSAKIILLNDPAGSVNAFDVQTGAKGIVSGEYNLGLSLGMVQQTDVLDPGDSIATSGLGGTFPRGLLIGSVREVKSTQDKLFQGASIDPPVDYSKLEMVFVIKALH